MTRSPNPVDDPLLGNPHDGHDNNLMSWVGDLDPTDPVVSPIFGSLGGLPPTTVYSSSHDLLTQQALRLRDKATAAGADFAFVLRKGQFHDWTIFAPPAGCFPGAGRDLSSTGVVEPKRQKASTQ